MGHIHETPTKRRARRTRHKLRSLNPGMLRLSVFRSESHIYAQIIDDTKGHTLASASTMDKAIAKAKVKGYGMAAAEQVGKVLAEKATKAGITQVMFDRGSFRYTGKIKALADAARAGGLQF